VFSRILDWNDRGTCVLFGDGAGAVVLEASDKPGILASYLHADGSYSQILNTPGQVCRGAIQGDPTLKMDGGAVFKLAVRVLEESAREALEGNGFQVADLDAYIAHQANVRILSHVAKKLGLPESKCIVTVDKHANTSAASVPLALDVAVRDGTRAAREASSSCRAWAAASRGALSWRATDMTLAITFPGQGSQSVGMMQGFAGLPVVEQTFREAQALVGVDYWSMVTRGRPRR
jgi:3-oxoacyl-(acyl-carrier-protein) synthase III